jgi:uncharacterized protein YbjT (DUF2867 family)
VKIAVAGATGRVGRHVMDVITERGHEAVPMSRATGVDVLTGEGLADALTGVDAIIDVATGPSPEEQAATEFFTTAARNLQAAGEKAGVRRIVVVSIVGIEKLPGGYNVAKLEHERAMREGPIPVRILRATQFHEFVEQLMQWGRQGDVITVPRMRTQLVAARAVAEELVRLATDPPPTRPAPSARPHPDDDAPAYEEIAGPRAEWLVEMARLIDPNVQESGGDEPSANGALLPGQDAILAGPTFVDWLDRPKATVEDQ